jgi:hypothetical protein
MVKTGGASVCIAHLLGCWSSWTIATDFDNCKGVRTNLNRSLFDIYIDDEKDRISPNFASNGDSNGSNA